MRLQDRVALITGAGRGIGRAIALAYAWEGARLALAARTSSGLEETARQAQKLGAATIVIPTDVTDRAQVDEMIRRTVDRFSTIDILVNNAGLPGPVGPLQDNDVDYWCRTIQVNVIGVFLCCRATLAVILGSDDSADLNGRVIQAAIEDLSTLPQRIPGIMASDAGTPRFPSSE